MIHRDLDIQHATTEKLHINLETITANYNLEKVVTHAKNAKIRMLERTLLELSADPGNVKHSLKLLRDKDNEISTLKQREKIPGPHPTPMPEIQELLKVKEEETQKNLATKEKNHKYLV